MVGAGYEGRGWQDKAAQESADLKATVHKGEVEAKGATINQGAENDFHTQKAAIANLYNTPTDGLPTAINNLPNVSKPAPGIKSSSCISRKYKLTPQQCDDAKAGYIALWDAWEAQAAIE